MKLIHNRIQGENSTQHDGVRDRDQIGNCSFLLLPFELRREIYKYSIIECRRPSAEIVHKGLLASGWQDHPSPLLGVNKQIRAEVFDLLQRRPFTMRITSQDKKFDCLALSAFIAQQRQGYGDIPHLVVEVWPPASTRPSEIYDICERLRELRDDLRATSQVSRFDLVFLENDMAKWSNAEGEPLHLLYPEFKWDFDRCPWDSDMICMLETFIGLSNIAEAHIYLPHSILAADEEKNTEIRDYARETEELMMGIHDVDNTLTRKGQSSATGWDYLLEPSYPCRDHPMALCARNQFDAIMSSGLSKITAADYADLRTQWPYLRPGMRIQWTSRCAYDDPSPYVPFLEALPFCSF